MSRLSKSSRALLHAEAGEDSTTPFSSGSWTTPRPAVLLAGVLALVALAYANALKGPFVWDDYVLIVDQPFVHQLRSPSDYLFNHSFWQSPETTEQRPYYRPLTVFSYGLDYALWGPNPVGFHLTNLLFHLVACALVFALCRRGGASPLAAAAATAFFGTFPRLTEAVAWISGRTDVLAGVGALSALLLHRSEAERVGSRILAATALLAGLFAKEAALAGFTALIALEAVPVLQRKASWPRAARNLVPASVATALYLGMHLMLAPPFNAATQPPLGTRLLLPFQTLGHYTMMLLDPLQPRLQIGIIGIVEPWITVLGGLAGVGLAILGVRILRGRMSAVSAAAIVLAAAGVGLVLHVIPFAVNIISADRFLYLPIAGLAVAGAIEMRRLGPRPRFVAAGVCVPLLASFAVATQVRNGDWANELRLWRVAVQHQPPDDPLPQSAFSDALLRLHRPAAALEHMRKAVDIYQQRVREHPWMHSVPAPLLGNIAIAWAELGQPAKARRILKSLIEKEPQAPIHHFNLAVLDARELHFEEAKRAIREALRLAPDFPAAKKLLSELDKAESIWRKLPPEHPNEPASVLAARARVYTIVGRVDAAKALWVRVAVAPEASPKNVRQAALFLTVRGDSADAKRAIRRLAQLSPGSSEPALLVRALDERGKADRDTSSARPSP